jgi:(2R)-sulfolactate sulfo-lyase subunit alpha
MIQFLKHGKDDNVAVAVVDAKKGEKGICLLMNTENKTEIKALSDIPLGHKIALKDFKVGDTIMKYDSDIGKVVGAIKAGEHVHVHNVKTKKW